MPRTNKKKLRHLIAMQKDLELLVPSRANWDEVYLALLNSPNPGCDLGEHRRNLLVELCDSTSPPHLVDLAASLFPESIIGRGALHATILSSRRRRRGLARLSNTTADIVKVLLDNLREDLGNDPKHLEDALLAERFLDGRGPYNPLHWACRKNADMATLKLLVEASPKKSVELTLDAFNESCFRIVRKMIRYATPQEGMEHDEEMRDTWEKMQFLFVEAYIASPLSGCPQYVTRDSPEKNKYLLHAIAGRPSKPRNTSSLLRIALRLCPRECLYAKDADGCTPLHSYVRRCGGMYDKRDVAVLLELAPETSKIPTRQGRYPLHLAIHDEAKLILRKAVWIQNSKVIEEERRGEGIIGLIINSYRPAVAIKGKWGLYPFQLAAVGNAPLDSIYELLRAKPDLAVE